MRDLDQLLGRAEAKKKERDPVKLEQRKLVPVRAWAVKARNDFLAACAILQPRMDAALARHNRLVSLLGPLDEPRRLWEQVQSLQQQIPNSYQMIVDMIDRLTPWQAEQDNLMNPLRQANAPGVAKPGNISHLIEPLERLERSLDDHTALLTARAAHT